MKIDDARARATKLLREIRQSGGSSSFEAIAEDWLERHVKKNKLRSGHELERFLRRHIIPAFAARDITQIGRKEISRLLDELEDNHGSRQADYGLAIIRQICKWQTVRDDNYASPVVDGMARHGIVKRDRILNDAELARIWRGAEGLFGNFIKLALLTAQRRDKLATMKWADVADGVWTVVAEAREKGTGEALELPAIAVEILEDQRRLNAEAMQIAGPLMVDAANPYVFAGRGLTHFSGYSKRKAALDKRVPVKPWTLHDLRRTSRSLMAAAGIPTLHAELVLGHKQTGVLGIYDRHDYLGEKGEALEKLAARIRDIVETPPLNVRKLRKSA